MCMRKKIDSGDGWLTGWAGNKRKLLVAHMRRRAATRLMDTVVGLFRDGAFAESAFLLQFGEEVVEGKGEFDA